MHTCNFAECDFTALSHFVVALQHVTTQQSYFMANNTTSQDAAKVTTKVTIL
jgi:hypothetical protein